MRTKIKVLSALIGLTCFGATVTQAQVYSLNVVGYVNVTCPPGYSMIANQLDSGTNTIYNLLANAQPGCSFFKYGSSGYTTFIFDEFDSVWYPANHAAATLAPGEGGFFYNPYSTNMVFTMVGEVMQGQLTNSIPAGYSIRSSMVPQAGDVNSVLSLPAQPGDTLFQYTPGKGYSTFIFDEFDSVWYPAPGPQIKVGESFFLFEQGSKSWIRDFIVQ